MTHQGKCIFRGLGKYAKGFPKLSAEGGVAARRVEFCKRDCGAGVAPALTLLAEPGRWRNQARGHPPAAAAGRRAVGLTASARWLSCGLGSCDITAVASRPPGLPLTSRLPPRHSPVWCELSPHRPRLGRASPAPTPSTRPAVGGTRQPFLAKSPGEHRAPKRE